MWRAIQKALLHPSLCYFVFSVVTGALGAFQLSMPDPWMHICGVINFAASGLWYISALEEFDDPY